MDQEPGRKRLRSALLFLLSFPFLWIRRYLSIGHIVLPVILITAAAALLIGRLEESGYIATATSDWIAVAYAALVTVLVITLALRAGDPRIRFWRTCAIIMGGLLGITLLTTTALWIAGVVEGPFASPDNPDTEHPRAQNERLRD